MIGGTSAFEVDLEHLRILSTQVAQLSRAVSEIKPHSASVGAHCVLPSFAGLASAYAAVAFSERVENGVVDATSTRLTQISTLMSVTVEQYAEADESAAAELAATYTEHARHWSAR